MAPEFRGRVTVGERPMTRLAWLALTCAGFVIGVGCSSTAAPDKPGPPSNGDAAAGYPGTDALTGGDSATTTGGGDAGADGPPAGLSFSGRRSFVVTGTVTQAPTGGGSVALSSHQFTMVIDADAGNAIVGDVGAGAVIGFVLTSPAHLRFPGPIHFSSGASSSGWTITYSELTVALEADGRLTGAAQGTASGYSASTDVGQSAMVTATLAGGPDTVPPALAVTRSGADDDPFSSLTVTASEPLPPAALPLLVAADGSMTALALPNGASSSFVRIFYGPGTLLRYGQGYQVLVDGITDFQGLPASGGAAFTTRSAPPLVGEDGFESASGTMLGGAQILTGNGAPTITGARSLYIPPIASTGAPVVRPAVTRLSLRLAVASGDTVIRFAYRLVNPSGALAIYFASEGGKIGTAQIGSGATSTETASIPGQGAVSLGPIVTAEIPLPSDVGTEVVLAEILPGLNGGLPAPPVSGVIIDDLRVE